MFVFRWTGCDSADFLVHQCAPLKFLLVYFVFGFVSKVSFASEQERPHESTLDSYMTMHKLVIVFMGILEVTAVVHFSLFEDALY
jgi:hypothetical protein